MEGNGLTGRQSSHEENGVNIMTSTVMNCGTIDHQKRVDAELDHLAEKHGKFRDLYNTAHYREIKQRIFELGKTQEACKRAIDIMTDDLYEHHRDEWFRTKMWSYGECLKHLLDETTIPWTSGTPPYATDFATAFYPSDTTRKLNTAKTGWAALIDGRRINPVIFAELISGCTYADDPKTRILHSLNMTMAINLA